MTFRLVNYIGPSWQRVPVATLTTYAPGKTCAGPAWYACTPDGEHVLLYVARHGTSIQRNTDKRVLQSIHPEATHRWIEQAYLPPGDTR